MRQLPGEGHNRPEVLRFLRHPYGSGGPQSRLLRRVRCGRHTEAAVAKLMLVLGQCPTDSAAADRLLTRNLRGEISRASPAGGAAG